MVNLFLPFITGLSAALAIEQRVMSVRSNMCIDEDPPKEPSLT